MAKKFKLIEIDEDVEKARCEKISQFRKMKGEETRLKLLTLINEGGGLLTNREIAERLDMSLGNVKRHLGIMYREGIIDYQILGGVMDAATKHPIAIRKIILVQEPKNAIPESKERCQRDDEKGPGATEAGPGDPKDVQ